MSIVGGVPLRAIGRRRPSGTGVGQAELIKGGAGRDTRGSGLAGDGRMVDWLAD